MKRAALIIGIDKYEDPAIRPLLYAERDATELHGFFKYRAGYDDVRLLQRAGEDEILNCAAEITRALAPGDLFVFFFAGHGITHTGRHLLLGPRARLRRLEFFQGAVPVDLLKNETAQAGVQRVFILDACRNDLEQGRDAAGPGLQGEQLLRDVVCGKTAASFAPLALVCSCAEGRKALEAPQLGQGLFSRALLEEMQAALEIKAELTCGEAFQQRLRERMGRLSEQCGLASDQHPWVQLSDEAPVLIPGGREPAGEDAPPLKSPAADAPNRPAKAICPACGLRNDPGDHRSVRHFYLAENPVSH